MYSDEHATLVDNSAYEASNDEPVIIKSYKHRWVILAMYGFTIISANSIQGSLFNITNLMLDYYGVTNSQMVLGATLAGVVAVLLVFPAGVIPGKYGLRCAVLIGSGMSAICAGIFVVASYEDGYYAFLLSTFFGGLYVSVIPQLIPEISAAWFPSDEQALATNISYAMQSIGGAISLVESMLLFNHYESLSKEELNWRIKLYMYLQSLPCVIVFFLNLAFFKDKPELPPTIAKLRQMENGEITFCKMIELCGKLIRNRSFIFLALAFALNYTVSLMYTLISNSLIAPRYDNVEEKVGTLGLILIGVSTVSAVIFSAVFDKWRRYKLQLLLHSILTVPVFVALALALIKVEKFFIVALIFTVFCIINAPTGGFIIEILAEVVYPININIPTALAILLGNLLGNGATQLSGWLIDNHWDKIVLWGIVCIFTFQVLLLFFVRVETKRSNMEVQEDSSVNS